MATFWIAAAAMLVIAVAAWRPLSGATDVFRAARVAAAQHWIWWGPGVGGRRVA